MRQSTGFNYLLQKDDIGKSKPTTRTLPHPDFTYGMPGPTDEEGVGKCNFSNKISNCNFSNFHVESSLANKEGNA